MKGLLLLTQCWFTASEVVAFFFFERLARIKERGKLAFKASVVSLPDSISN